MGITSIFDRADHSAPLYCKHQDEYIAQPAFLELDPEESTVTADYSEENGIPSPVWHGRLRRYKVPPTLKGKAIPHLLEQLMPLFERVSSGYTCEWDGSNMIGILTEDAMSAEKEIERICRVTDPESLAEIYDTPDELLYSDNLDDFWLPGQTLDEAVSELMENATGSDFVLLFDADDMRRYLLSRASELANAGHSLSSEQRAALLAEGYKFETTE